MSRRALAPLIAILAALGVAGALPSLAQERSFAPPVATPIASPPVQPSGDGTGVRLATELGDIVIGLFTESSPVAAENFLNLVEGGFYDGLTFHRLVPGFVIQGGDPSGDGSGGPGYTIPDEPVVGRYGRGIVAMARTQQPDSQGSQFFVVLDDGAEGGLEQANTYAIFGRVLEGMDVVDAIAAMPNAGDLEGNRALDPVVIESATVEQVTLPPEPSRAPPGAPDLEVLFPADIGGVPVEIVSSINGLELRSQFAADDPATPELEAILASQGKTIEDMSVVSGGAITDAGPAQILALRISGADASQLIDDLGTFIVGYEDVQQQPVSLGGKDVVVLTSGPDGPSLDPFHVYADGDLLWLVSAVEPALSEIFTKLP